MTSHLATWHLLAINPLTHRFYHVAAFKKKPKRPTIESAMITHYRTSKIKSYILTREAAQVTLHDNTIAKEEAKLLDHPVAEYSRQQPGPPISHILDSDLPPAGAMVSDTSNPT